MNQSKIGIDLQVIESSPALDYRRVRFNEYFQEQLSDQQDPSEKSKDKPEIMETLQHNKLNLQQEMNFYSFPEFDEAWITISELDISLIQKRGYFSNLMFVHEPIFTKSCLPIIKFMKSTILSGGFNYDTWNSREQLISFLQSVLYVNVLNKEIILQIYISLKSLTLQKILVSNEIIRDLQKFISNLESNKLNRYIQFAIQSIAQHDLLNIQIPNLNQLQHIQHLISLSQKDQYSYDQKVQIIQDSLNMLAQYKSNESGLYLQLYLSELQNGLLNQLYKFCKFLGRFDLSSKHILQYDCDNQIQLTFSSQLLNAEHIYLSLDYDINNKVVEDCIIKHKIVLLQRSVFAITSSIMVLKIDDSSQFIFQSQQCQILHQQSQISEVVSLYYAVSKLASHDLFTFSQEWIIKLEEFEENFKLILTRDIRFLIQMALVHFYQGCPCQEKMKTHLQNAYQTSQSYWQEGSYYEMIEVSILMQQYFIENDEFEEGLNFSQEIQQSFDKNIKNIKDIFLDEYKLFKDNFTYLLVANNQ